MSYSIYLALTAATAGLDPAGDQSAEAAPDVAAALEPALHSIRQLVERFRGAPVTPLATAQFEHHLQLACRQLARLPTQWTYNPLEPAEVQTLPQEVRSQGSTFRRLGQKTPQQVSTLFGPITVRRLGYRAAPAEGQPVLF